MSRETVGKALNAMAEADVCEKVAAGDLSVLGDLEFDDRERKAVVAAAKDYPEVSGYAFGRLNFSSNPPQGFNFEANGSFGEAAHYAFGKNAGPLATIHVSL